MPTSVDTNDIMLCRFPAHREVTGWAHDQKPGADASAWLSVAGGKGKTCDSGCGEAMNEKVGHVTVGYVNSTS